MWEPGKKKHPIESAYTHHIVHLEAIKGLIASVPAQAVAIPNYPRRSLGYFRHQEADTSQVLKFETKVAVLHVKTDFHLTRINNLK